MIYLNDVVYEWLSLTFPEVDWRFDGQVNAYPMPQNDGVFGFIRLTHLENLAVNLHTDTFNEADEKIDRTLKNSYKARVSIDIYSQDESNAATDAALVAAKIVAYLDDVNVKEYFDSNNVGFLYVDSIQDLSLIESGQIRKRWHVETYFNIEMSYDTQIGFISSIPLDTDISK